MSKEKDHKSDEVVVTEAEVKGPSQEVPTTVTRDVIAEAQERGFRGTETDPTPNKAYTFGGVISGQPTPETDEDYAETVEKQLKQNRKGL